MPSPPFLPHLTTRPEPGTRRRPAFRAVPALALSALLPLVLALGACGSGAAKPSPAPPRAAPQQPFATGEQNYLVDPLAGYPRDVDPGRSERLREVHRALLSNSEREAAVETAAGMLEADPSFHPAQVLIGQVELGEGEPAKVVARLLPVSDEMPQFVAAQLLLGRAAELTGDIPLAYAAFREIAARNPRAFQRIGELHPRAVEIVSNRLGEAVRQGRLEDADAQLALLKAWAPSEIRTLEGERAVAVAREDRRAELAAVKQLSALRPGERALVERRAELELAVGDPSAGLQIIQALVQQNPNDPVLAEKLAAAKFRWRVSLLPRDVQELASKTELDKADLAVLLYWMVPNVRYGRSDTGRIATDILDHPQQEAIVRVVNLGLMDVDRTLHRFSPGAPARRAAALRSLVLILARFGKSVSCLGGAGRGYPTQSEVCQAASDCGLIPAGDECNPSSALAGGEAVELIRRTLEHLGGS